MESISHAYFTKLRRQSTQFSKKPKLILGGLSGYWLSLFCLLTWVMPADSHGNRSVQSLVEGQLKLSSSLRVGQSGTLTLYCFSRSNIDYEDKSSFDCQRELRLCHRRILTRLIFLPSGNNNIRLPSVLATIHFKLPSTSPKLMARSLNIFTYIFKPHLAKPRQQIIL